MKRSSFAMTVMLILFVFQPTYASSFFVDFVNSRFQKIKSLLSANEPNICTKYLTQSTNHNSLHPWLEHVMIDPDYVFENEFSVHDIKLLETKDFNLSNQNTEEELYYLTSSVNWPIKQPTSKIVKSSIKELTSLGYEIKNFDGIVLIIDNFGDNYLAVTKDTFDKYWASYVKKFESFKARLLQYVRPEDLVDAELRLDPAYYSTTRRIRDFDLKSGRKYKYINPRYSELVISEIETFSNPYFGSMSVTVGDDRIYLNSVTYDTEGFLIPLSEY